MTHHLLLISDLPEDFKMVQALCEQETNLILQRALNQEEVEKALESLAPQTVVIWDSDNVFLYKKLQKILPTIVAKNRLFALTSKPLQPNTSQSEKYSIIGHYFVRRHDPLQMTLLLKIINTILAEKRFGIQCYFPPTTKVQKIIVKQISHKSAAIEAIQKVLTQLGVTNRLAALVAQSTDELMLNAIFNAPLDQEGQRFRKGLLRDSSLIFKDNQEIEVTFAIHDQYMGICVKDQFGSLSVNPIANILGGSSEKTGLIRIFQAGISLLFVCQPKVCTEVTIFFRITKSYKDFKNSFHFISTIF